jgi:hypothetical protein
MKLVHSRTSKKVSKNYNENGHRRSLPKLPIVPRKDFGPLGVNVNRECNIMSIDVMLMEGATS